MNLKIIGLLDLDYCTKNFYSVEFKCVQLFNKLVNEFYNLSNINNSSDQMILYEGEKEIPFYKNAFFVSNFFEYHINSKQILTKIFNLLEENININFELKTKFQNKANEIMLVFHEALKDINIDFTWEEDVSINEFAKVIGLKIDTSDTDSIFQKLLSFIDVISELRLYKLIIFPNIKLFFEENELEEIFKYTLYRGIKILCLDSFEYKKLFANENKIIIDEFYDTEVVNGK